jgi:cellulose synthase/poly-beta-1,6-N-acetylglucosamine synthase-like glycosyltransferase
MVAVEVLLWTSLALIAWTHVGYPLAVALVARVRPRPVRAADIEPRVALVITAYNEEDVIEQKLENALALDYPRDLLRIVVASDASSDATDAIVRSFADRGVELEVCPRGGKVNAQNVTVRRLMAGPDAPEILAFSDANCLWPANALRRLVRAFADPEVAYACGRLALRSPEGTNQEGAYWRYEIWLREQESRVGSVTGGNGSIYAVRPDFYEEVDTRWGHDLSFPYRMVKRGRRAVFVPDALAIEKMSTDLEDEFRRKVRMFGHCWLLVLHGRMFGLRALGPLYWVEMISHRLLRYASGLLHVVLLVTSAVLAATQGGIYLGVLGAQVLFALLVLASVASGGRVRLLAIPHYYLLVTWATVVALFEVAVKGVQPVWEKAEGTR